MLVKVKLNASLRRFLPAGTAGNVAEVELPDGATVDDVITSLGIPDGHARMAVSDNEQLEPTTQLRDGQEVALFPPLAGG